MLNKLKRRMIWSSVIPVAIVLVLLLIAAFVFTSQMQKNELFRSLDIALEATPPMIGPGGMHRPQTTGTCTVIATREGAIIDGSISGNVSLDENTLLTATRAVVASEESEGVISSMNLAFKTRALPNGTRISFASTEGYESVVRTTMIVAGSASCIILLCVYLISLWQAKAAVRPVAEAMEQQRRFVADASHDLKTPLTVMLANLDILRSHLTELPEEEKRWIDSTVEEAERMKGLTLSLLELAKSEGLSARLSLSETDITTPTEQAVLQYEPVAFEAGVTILTDIQPQITVLSDRATYLGIVETLLDNAVKYSPQGGEVTVRLSGGKSSVVLSVHNGGTPISAEDLPHIFERFRRGDKARDGNGYGLGLAIAKNYAEALGAELSVTSTEDCGTTFSMMMKPRI